MSNDNIYLRAIENESAVESDMVTLSKWVREELFFVLIHDLKNEDEDTMSVDGPLCGRFVKCFLTRDNRACIVNPDIVSVTNDKIVEAYLKHLWEKGLNKDAKGTRWNIRKNLSLEKTAVYAAISDAFKSELLF